MKNVSSELAVRGASLTRRALVRPINGRHLSTNEVCPPLAQRHYHMQTICMKGLFASKVWNEAPHISSVSYRLAYSIIGFNLGQSEAKDKYRRMWVDKTPTTVVVIMLQLSYNWQIRFRQICQIFPSQELVHFCACLCVCYFQSIRLYFVKNGLDFNIFVIEWRHCESCTPIPWHTFSMSSIWNVNISETVRAGANMQNTILYIFIFAKWYLSEYRAINISQIAS